jgi:predicted nucleic acid-binding protein
MTFFVDTSGLFALMDEGDPRHDRAVGWLEDVTAESGQSLITHSYVVNEAIALTHARLGGSAVRTLIDDVLPALDIRFVDRALHDRAIAAFLAGLGRRISFVDRTSFELMRLEGIRHAFSFDDDFADEGFTVVP